MTFRDLEKNTDKLDDASNMYGELKNVGRTNLFNYVSSIGKRTDLRNAISTSGSATFTNDGAEYVLSTTANGSDAVTIGTEKRGRYSPGEIAEAGIGIRTTSRPTGNQEWRAGPFNGTNGFYLGEDSDGYFVARLSGGTEQRIRQENWNQDTLDGSGDENNPSGLSLDFDDGHVIRFDYAWYGHGETKIRLVMNKPTAEAGEGNENSQEVVTIHSFYPKGEVSTNQSSLPVEAKVENNGTAESFDLFMAGRQFTILGDGRQSNRVNGETRLGQSLSDTSWTPLISFQKRTGDEAIPVSVEGFKLNSDADIEYSIQTVDPGNLNNSSFGLATNTSSSETAVEVDTSADGFSSLGERRFVDFIAGGNSNSTTAEAEQGLDFEVPEAEVVVLAARAPGGTATVDSVLRWKEGF